MRRRRESDAAVSLDSFLDIVTNVVGVLILIAVVTVISAGDIAVSSGASALVTPRASANRVMFHLHDNQVYFFDEKDIADRIDTAWSRRTEAALPSDDMPLPARVIEMLDDADVGDDTYRVRAFSGMSGLVWQYDLRRDARGETIEDLDYDHSDFATKLDELGPGDYVYVVVNDDSFELFRKVREVVRARGLALGWHPVEGQGYLRLSNIGSLGKRIQ